MFNSSLSEKSNFEGGGRMTFTFGFLGIIGGIICACGDILLDLKGKDNMKTGKYQIIDSKWNILFMQEV